MRQTNHRILFALVAVAGIASCDDDTSQLPPPAADMAQPPVSGDMAKGSGEPDLAIGADMAPPVDPDAMLKDKVKTIVYIYAENRSFDNIYGAFPGANGIPQVNPTSTGTLVPQTDRDAANTLLTKLPVTWGGVTIAGQATSITEMMSDNVPNKPFPIETTWAGVDASIITRDLYHRFFENQMQLNGGKGDKFAAYADSGGLVMGYYDGSKLALWQVAKDYVLADNTFQGAFGGSFLNHQYIICGCAPEYPDADTATAKPTIAVIDSDGNGGFVPRLTLAASTKASALDGPPVYTLSGNIAPKNYFGDNTFRAINTMQPPYQPSGNLPPAADTTKLYADPGKPNTLPEQTQMTVGDQLDAKSITWAWYAGAWDSSVAIATGDHQFPSGLVPSFQFHHQPFNYYKKFDPATNAAARTAHLKDYTKLVADAAAGTLPQVVFYKPEGDLNQHAGYASVAAGDQHLADVIAKLKASPQFANMVIVLTYDENGGWWDHVSPPKGDKIGPGSRIPALIVSPFAKKGTVDHTQYDSASVLRLISRRFGLTPLPGVVARDTALKTNGGQAMGDFTNALDLK
jgi:acid phosphatase